MKHPKNHFAGNFVIFVMNTALGIFTLKTTILKQKKNKKQKTKTKTNKNQKKKKQKYFYHFKMTAK